MIAAPKIWREVRRLGRQTIDLPAELFRKVYFRRWYDVVRSREIRRTKGALLPRPEMAVYVIYPSRGLQRSHLDALQQIVSDGIAPLVVSNLPLAEAERARLLSVCVAILERPNIGYDFGGYRDGILELEPSLATLDRLWILNDSCWLLPKPRSWFAEARSLGLDLVGATSNYGFVRPSLQDLRPFPWSYSTRSKDFHYASYALSLGPRLISSPQFLKFWRRLDIRSDKKKTVRRGEIGLTQWAMVHGYSHGCTTRLETLDATLALLSDDEVDGIAKDLIILEDPWLMALARTAFKNASTTAEGRSDRTVIILMAVARQGSVYALAGYLVDRGFPFLKKSPLWLSPQAADTMARIVGRLEGPMANTVQQETRHLRPDTRGNNGRPEV